MNPALYLGAVVPLLIAGGAALVETQTRRALRTAQGDPAAGWFGAALSVSWTALGFWAAWALAAAGPATRALMHAAFPADLAGAATALWFVVPPLAFSGWAQWRLARVGNAIRGTEVGTGRLVRNLARILFAVLLAIVAFAAGPALLERGASPLSLLLGALAALLALLAFTGKPADDEAPSALTAGELRDRIVAIAARAGVTVKQLYVLPQARARVANAFAAPNQSVLLTDYLLAHLGRDEVDAVMAHELAHLHRGHPQRLGLMLLGVAFAAATLWLTSRSAALAVAAFALGMLGFLAVSRAIEYRADAGAIALGARAEALVSGLARLARLNHVPARWSRALEWTLTHPSLERRARAIAARAGWTPEHTRALLAVEGRAADLYELPAALASGQKVFSTALKLRLHARVGWLLLAGGVALPALAIAALAAAAPAAPRVVLTNAALIAGAGATILLARWLGGFPRSVRPRLARRLEDRGLGAHASEARFVGLAPGGDTRVIEGFYVWDAGFLKLAKGHLDYAGEETSFTLTAGRVRKIELVAGPPAWMRTRCVRVTWLDDAGSWCTLRLFALEPGAGAARGSEALFEALDSWRRSAVPTESGARLSFGEARHHEVTSIAPADQLQLGGLITGTVLQFVLALIVTGALGLPLAPWQGPGLIEVWAAAVLGNLMLTLPLLQHREPARIERRCEADQAA